MGVNPRLIVTALSVVLLGVACSQEANDDTVQAPSESQIPTAVDESQSATTVPATDDTEFTTTTYVPRLSVILEQRVGGSLLDPDRAADGSIVAPTESSYTNAVAVTPAGLVAVGESRDVATGNLDAAVWISSDGHEWLRVEDESGVLGDLSSPFGEGSEQIIVDITVTSSGVIAVGTDGVLGNSDAAIWVSDDGSAWERVQYDPAVFGGEGNQLINSVAELDGLLVAVGGSGGSAAVWTSDSRDAWTEADVIGSESGPSLMNDVASFSGGLVAVGSAGADQCPAVWLSADGRTWQRVTAEMAGEGSYFAAVECEMSPMSDVAVVSGTLVAVGTRLLPDEDPTEPALTTDGPLVWTSVDGYEWLLEDAEFVLGGVESRYGYLRDRAPIALEQVISDGQRLFAVGSYELLPSANDVPGFASLWYSDNGGTIWLLAGESALPPAGVPLGARGLARFDSGLVLVGADAAPAGKHPDYGWMTWLSTPAVWIVSLGR